MLFNPMQFALDALWFWSVMTNAMLSDLSALSGRKHAVALVVIAGGKQ